jgi:hypothetical protein
MLLNLIMFVDRTLSHWAVFFSSTAIVLSFWGITPFQAGIFSTEPVELRTEIPIRMSASYPRADIPCQERSSSVEYVYSAYAMTFLSEKLQPFMTQSYTLVPFEPTESSSSKPYRGTLSAKSYLYGMDLDCDDNIPNHPWEGEPWPPPDEIEDLYYKSEVTNCSVSWLYLQYFAPNGSYVIGEPSRVDPSKRNRPFDMLQKIESLENDTPFQREALMCSNPARGAFLAVLAENKQHPQDPYGRVARLLCRPRFYRQTVLAMISWPERSVQGLRDLGANFCHSYVFRATPTQTTRRVSGRSKSSDGL